MTNTNVSIFGFSKPMILDENTWQSNIFVWIGEYLVSFTGENSSKTSNRSTKHLLYIGFGNSYKTEDLTKKLGFKEDRVSIQDFFDAIEKVKSLNNKK